MPSILELNCMLAIGNEFGVVGHLREVIWRVVGFKLDHGMMSHHVTLKLFYYKEDAI